MKKQLTISIPEPCHEEWEGMTPVERGRFCGSCQKTVVDFSGMTDKQILEVWKENSYAMPCGRYLPSQLNRPMVASPKPGFAAQWLKRAAALLLLIEAPAAYAQQKPATHMVTVPQEQDMKWPDGMSDVAGQLLAPVTNKPVVGQQLYIADIGATVITDSSGRFSFSISDTVSKVKIKIGAQGAFGAEQELKIESPADGPRYVVVMLTAPAVVLPYDPLRPEIYVQGAVPWYPQRDIVTSITGMWCVMTDTIFAIKKDIRLPFSMKPRTGKSVMARLTNYWSGGKGQ